MITTKDFTSHIGDTITVKYPTGTIFMRERNYLTVSSEAEDYYLKKITLAGKTINFGRYYLQGNPITLDVTPYYAKLYTSGTISLVVETSEGKDETFTVSFTINKVEGYSPFLEFVPERCGDATYARIVPPNRILWDGNKKTTSMLAAVRDDDYFSGYEYEMDGVPYESFRPSNEWVTTSQKNEHLGETYRNTLKYNGNLAELDGNGNPLWIEQGGLRVGTEYYGLTFGQQRYDSKRLCRTKTIFNNYVGLTIGAPPDGFEMLIAFYDTNMQYAGNIIWRNKSITLDNAHDFPFISIIFIRSDKKDYTPSELTSLTSTELTNPEAGKSYRWVEQNGVFSWLELTAEQIINNSFAWYFGGQRHFDDVINKTATFEKSFEALYQRVYALSPTTKQYTTIQKVSRSASLADSSMPYVYIRWRTPWGVTVEHLFYLGSYSSDKADAKELESVNYYEELSQHVRVGSFYLDGIVQPYDLFYYKTLENAELVEMYFPSYAFKPSTYMPNGDTYVAVKITGSNIKDAVVDGVAQSTITFDFEMR